MVPEPIVQLANLLQTSVPVLSLLAYFPQWSKIIRSRTSTAISARSWLLWGCTGAFTLFYAIVQLLLNDRGWPLVISSVTGLVFVLLTLLLILKYRPRPQRDT